MSKIVFFIVSINYCYFQVRGRLNHLKSTPASRICLIMSGLGEKMIQPRVTGRIRVGVD